MATYEEVYNEFYDNNSKSEIMDAHLTFEKKKDKWYITTYDYFDYNKVDSSYLFYENGHFVKLPPPSPNKTLTGNFKQKINETDVIYYNLHQYYGYKGWYKDVIKDAQIFDYKTDSANYSLARAYSALANGLMFGRYRDARADALDLKLNNNCLSVTQIKLYDSLENLAIIYFKKTLHLNPAYKTIIGPIQIKYANECVEEFNMLLNYAQNASSAFILPDNIYPDSLLNRCRQVLSDCPKDAILLSYGDNDYYPILYLQQHDRFRRDVYLIHTTLLSIDRFIYHYQTPQLDAPGIDMGKLDLAIYEGEQNNYLEIEAPNTAKNITIDDLMRYLVKGKSASDEPELIDAVNAPKSNNIKDLTAFLDQRKRAIPASTIILKTDANGKPLINLSLNDTRFLGKNTWILYVIIHHLTDRKLCSPTLPDYELKNLIPFFKKNKSIYVMN